MEIDNNKLQLIGSLCDIEKNKGRIIIQEEEYHNHYSVIQEFAKQKNISCELFICNEYFKFNHIKIKTYDMPIIFVFKDFSKLSVQVLYELLKVQKQNKNIWMIFMTKQQVTIPTFIENKCCRVIFKKDTIINHINNLC